MTIREQQIEIKIENKNANSETIFFFYCSFCYKNEVMNDHR